MKLKHLLTIAALIAGAGTAWAQTDVTSTYITNADFSSTTGWTNYSGGGSEHSEDSGLIGTLNLNSKPSTTDATHLATEYCFGFSARWNGRYTYYQQVLENVQAGAYTLSYDVQDVNSSSTKYNMDNHFYVQVGDTKYSDSATEWMNAGASSWTAHTISFTLNETSNVTISFGYGNKENKGTSDCPAIYVSHLKLEVFPFATSSDYEALNTAISAVEGTTWGFDAGEYAPYNYVKVIQALAEAQAIDKDANNSQASVQTLTATLNTSMTANAAEVNAIWDPSFEHDYSGQTGNVQPIGWYREKNNYTGDGYNVRYMNLPSGTNTSGHGVMGKFTLMYGEEPGYTLPLNEAYYTLSFIYGGWNEVGTREIRLYNDDNNAEVFTNTVTAKNNQAHTTSSAYSTYNGFIKVPAAGNYVLSFYRQSTNAQNQIVLSDFVLKTTTLAEATTYYNSVKTSVESGYDASANGGAEKTAFKNALDADVSVMTVAEIMEAAAALPGLRDAFVNAVSTFDALAAEIVKAGNLGVDAETIAANTATSSTTAAEAKTYTQNLKVAEYNYVTTNFGYGVELGTWTEEGPTGSLSDQHWSGESRPYLEQSSAAWNQSAWEIKYSQNVTLPAGSYVFKVAGRQADSDGVTLSLEVKNGETLLGTVSDFPRADVGYGINTIGETDYDPSHSYANNNAGRGWEWRYVKFTLDDLATVNVAVSAVATTAHMWVSFCDATVQATSADVAALLAALAEYDAALAAATDAINNTAYANVQGLEKTYLQEAIDADGTLDKSSLDDVQAATNALTVNTGSFTGAVNSYDAFYQAKAEQTLTKITENVGDGVFQYNATTNDGLWDAYESAKSTVDNFDVTTGTASAVKSYADALNGAINAYNTQALNAPAADKRYYLNIVDAGQSWDGNAVTFIAGGRNDMGNYLIQYLAPANEYMNQALKFTAVGGEKVNTYIVSAINVEDGAERYITTGNTYSGGYATQIRTTDDVTKASWIKIQATTTDGQFQLLNVSDGNKVIGRNATNPDNGMYTDGNNSFTIAEASQASVTVSCKAGKYGTVIFPFTPDVSTGFDGITFYSCETVNGATEKVQITEVNTPVANVPYLIKNDGGDNFSQALTGWGVATADSYTEGLLTGVFTAATIPAGANNFVLQTQGDVQAFYKVDTDFTATAYKCYLTYNSGAGAGVKALGFEFRTPTSVRGLEMAEGQNGTIFNLAGQRVQKAQRGLYIVNGKKVLVK